MDFSQKVGLLKSNYKRGFVPLTLCLIVVVGMFVRFYCLAAESLWFDEACSWRMVQFPWSEIVSRIGGDYHPPLYFLVLKAWVSVVGDSVVAMRVLSGLFGVGTLLGVYLFASEAYGAFPKTLSETEKGTASWTALLATTLVALSNFQIVHAREVRMYTLGSLLAVFSSWLLLKALRGRGSQPVLWVSYAILASGLAYVHNYGQFTVAAQVVFTVGFVVWQSRRYKSGFFRMQQLRYPVFAIVGIAMAWAPWIPVLLRQRDSAMNDFWIPPLSLHSVSATVEQIFSGNRQALAPSTGAVAAMLVAVVLGCLLVRRRASDCYVVLLTVIPFALALGISIAQGRNILVGKYLFFSFPFLMVGVASLIQQIPTRPFRWTVCLALLLNLVVQDCVYWQVTDVRNNPGLRAAATEFLRRRRDGDLLLTLAPGDFLPLTYYTRNQAKPLLFRQDGRSLHHYLGQSVIRNDEIIYPNQLSAQGTKRAWLITNKHRRPIYLKSWELLWQGPEFTECAPYRGRVYLDLWQLRDATAGRYQTAVRRR